MGLDKELGDIRPGKLADVVLLNGDPLARISDVRRVSLVIKDGIVYRPNELDREIGVAPLAP